jgi:hypothetical protein
MDLKYSSYFIYFRAKDGAETPARNRQEKIAHNGGCI